jgi:hypothetical protein
MIITTKIFVLGVNYCPENSKCRKFKEIYSSSENFCNTVWDNSLNVTTNHNCISFSFNTTKNPNKKVAHYYSVSGMSLTKYSKVLLALSVLVFAF